MAQGLIDAAHGIIALRALIREAWITARRCLWAVLAPATSKRSMSVLTGASEPAAPTASPTLYRRALLLRRMRRSRRPRKYAPGAPNAVASTALGSAEIITSTAAAAQPTRTATMKSSTRRNSGALTRSVRDVTDGPQSYVRDAQPNASPVDRHRAIASDDQDGGGAVVVAEGRHAWPLDRCLVGFREHGKPIGIAGSPHRG